jgi:hypothetical protein
MLWKNTLMPWRCGGVGWLACGNPSTHWLRFGPRPWWRRASRRHQIVGLSSVKIGPAAAAFFLPSSAARLFRAPISGLERRHGLHSLPMSAPAHSKCRRQQTSPRPTHHSACFVLADTLRYDTWGECFSSFFFQSFNLFVSPPILCAAPNNARVSVFSSLHTPVSLLSPPYID